MEQQQDFLQPFEDHLYLERVSAGIRFANYIIDVIVFYVILFIAMAIFGTATVLSKSSGDYYGTGEPSGLETLVFFVVLLIPFAYYTVTEAVFKGRTIGKMITGCRAVMNDGSDITWKTAFLRTLCRIVPFEAFSAFGGNPWHDQWTSTQVVKVRK